MFKHFNVSFLKKIWISFWKSLTNTNFWMVVYILIWVITFFPYNECMHRLSRSKKHHKNTIKVAPLLVFWSYTIALCDEQTKMK